MIIFLFAVFVLFMHLVYENTKDEKSRKYIWIFVCVITVLFVGLRSSHFGADTFGYVGRFKSLINMPWKSVLKIQYKDTGYIYFVKAISMITDSEVMFLVITAFLSYIGVFDIIKRNCERPVLALFFFVTLGNFLFLMTGIRQAIAMSLCLLSVRFIQDRKLIPFLILVWLGAQLHHSAYIFAVTYILAVRPVAPVSIITNILVTIVAYIFYENLLEIANDMLEYNYGVEELDNGFIFYAIIIIILILGFITRKQWINDAKQTVIMNLGIFCGIIWTFRLIGRTAERPSMYFLTAIPIVLVNACDSLESEKNGKIILGCAVVLSLILFFLRCIGMKYRFFWS